MVVSGVRRPSCVVRPSVRRPSTFSKDFSSETTVPISIKFHMQPLDRGGKKVYIFRPGHMAKMAAMPIYGKNLKKIFLSRTARLIALKLSM